MHGYVYIWKFEVETEKVAEFLSHYGPVGTWSRLFRRSAGYVETLLLQDRQASNSYVTIDRWESSEAHDKFIREHRADYERLDRLCESLTRTEQSLGSYWEVLPNASAA